MNAPEIQLVECPRDAMQGWPTFISTTQKIAYLQQLLKVGFHTLDCLSFVSAKAIPQMADSHDVAKALDPGNSATRLLAIVVNERGATEASQYDIVGVLGYPFSISPTFQQRNAHSSMEESWQRLMQIQNICQQRSKELVVYLSMGFGNPYGDAFDESLVLHWVHQMEAAGIRTISLADTVGVASPETIQRTTTAAIAASGKAKVGVHLHSTATNWQAKMEAAYTAGCRRFDGALKGYGGCPMAEDVLVGNMNTEWMVEWFEEKQVLPAINKQALQSASHMASQVFIQ
ncbi:MAG TPA: hypothetical protein VLC98_16500 [Phnomibacter sp.]|nr:hypothetical protein [Phnomibacter sp.]